MYDVAIIGYGPAGVTCGLYLRKIGYQVVLIGKDSGGLTEHDIISNYYGLAPNTDGVSLIQSGLNQAIAAGIEVKHQTVYDVLDQIDHLCVVTNSESIKCRALVLATGKKRLGLNVEGFHRLRGRGIHLCASCDGYFYRQKRLVLVGHGDYLHHELKVIKHYTNLIRVITTDQGFKDDTVEVIHDEVLSFGGNDKLKVITTKGGKSIETDGCFIALGFPTSLELADKMGIITSRGSIAVDEHYQTNVRGVFACGDCIGGKLQITKAVYDGMVCSDFVHQHLKGKLG